MADYHKTVNGVDARGKIAPEDVSLDTSGFDRNLDTEITDVQKLADRVDELNTVQIYEELPLEREAEVAYCGGGLWGRNITPQTRQNWIITIPQPSQAVRIITTQSIKLKNLIRNYTYRLKKKRDGTI